MAVGKFHTIDILLVFLPTRFKFSSQKDLICVFYKSNSMHKFLPALHPGCFTALHRALWIRGSPGTLEGRKPMSVPSLFKGTPNTLNYSTGEMTMLILCLPRKTTANLQIYKPINVWVHKPLYMATKTLKSERWSVLKQR